jgi:hypothetical protein
MWREPHSAGSMQLMALTAMCCVLMCAGRNECSRLVPETERSPIFYLFHTTAQVTFCWCDARVIIIFWGTWLPKIMQIYFFSIEFKGNIGSPEMLIEYKEIPSLQIFCITSLQRLFLHPLSSVVVLPHSSFYTHKRNLLMDLHELWNGEHGSAYFLCESTSAEHAETFV